MPKRVKYMYRVERVLSSDNQYTYELLKIPVSKTIKFRCGLARQISPIGTQKRVYSTAKEAISIWRNDIINSIEYKVQRITTLVELLRSPDPSIKKKNIK